MLVPTEYIDFMHDVRRDMYIVIGGLTRRQVFLQAPHRIIGPSVRLALPSEDPTYTGKGYYEIHYPGWSNGDRDGRYSAA